MTFSPESFILPAYRPDELPVAVHNKTSTTPMAKGLLPLLFFILAFSDVDAQIYAQGHNINNMSIYSLSVVLVRQPNGTFLASLDFRGRRKDVTWYIKEGAVHKSFIGESDMIAYMAKNGWVFTERLDILSNSGQFLGDQYMFRKSMEQLSTEEEEKKP